MPKGKDANPPNAKAKKAKGHYRLQASDLPPRPLSSTGTTKPGQKNKTQIAANTLSSPSAHQTQTQEGLVPGVVREKKRKKRQEPLPRG
jgi:hypothetical protein